MNLFVKRLPVMVVFLFCLQAQELLAQDQAKPSQPTFRSTTRLVVVDVVATDEKGSPVKDLKAEDFVVSENKEPQKVVDFGFHQPGNTATASHQPAPNVFSNSPLYSGNSSLNVILLDAINTDFSNHAYAQDMLVKYLGTNPSFSLQRFTRWKTICVCCTISALIQRSCGKPLHITEALALPTCPLWRRPLPHSPREAPSAMFRKDVAPLSAA